MGRHPLTIIAIKPPDGDRGAHDLSRSIARHALILRRHLALVHVGHQAVRILRETGIYSAVDRVGLEGLAEHRQQVPLPLAPQERLGQGLEMLPAFSRLIQASAGGEQREMGVVRPMTTMRMEHHKIAPSQRLAPDGALEIVEALHATTHERAQHARRVLVKGRAEHGRHRQDHVPRDHPLVKDPAHLVDPVIDRDFGTPQAQRRLTAPRHQVLALATVQAAIRDRAYFFRVAARQHLGHQAIVIRRLVARMGLLKRLPVVSKDLLEDIPVPRGGCHHRIAPSGGDQSVAMERLYHASAASSTPHPASLRYPHPTRLSLMNESFRDRKNAFSYTTLVSGKLRW